MGLTPQNHINWMRWCTPIILTLERQRQDNYFKSKASLGYIVDIRLARATQDPISKTNK